MFSGLQTQVNNEYTYLQILSEERNYNILYNLSASFRDLWEGLTISRSIIMRNNTESGFH